MSLPRPRYYFHYEIADIDVADSHWLAIPVAGKITKIVTTLGAGGASVAADTAITFEIGGTAVTGGGITITASGSAEGDIDIAYPTAANTVAANSALEIISDGASTASAALSVCIEVTPV